MSHVDQLAVIEMACGSEIAEFLESTSEGTFLTNAHYQQPEHTGSELTLECHLIDVLAYYSFFLEMLLVESFNSKQAHAKELDELAALEEAKSNKMVNQKLKGESAMQGNETTEEMLPKIGGDTSHDVAAATSHGVGSAEQGTGVIHAKELDELAALEEAKSNKLVNQKLKGEIAEQGNKSTEETLPKIGGDTSHDVAAATAHGVGSAEQGTGVTPHKPGGVTSHDVSSSTSVGVGSAETAKAADNFLWVYHEFLDLLTGPTTFLDYKKRKPLIEIYKLPHSRKEVIVLTRFGRKIARRLLKYILKIHKSGQCWQGLFSDVDIEVTSKDSLFRIVNICRVAASRDGIFADLKKYFDIILAIFSDDEDHYPLFFDELMTDLLKCPGHDSVKFDAFRRTIVVHFALMPPQSWTDLMFKLRELIPFNHLALKDHIGWLPSKRFSPFEEIYEYKCTPGNSSYMPKYGYLLKYARNFPSHGLKHIKNLPGYKTANIKLVAIMLADHLGRHFIALINHLIARVIMDADGVLREEYVSAWIAFESSDDPGDDNEDRIDYENLLYDDGELSDDNEP